MAAVLTRLRAELRARWKAWSAIALLIGLAGGAVLTTAAGARRTDTAYARYLHSSRAADVLISPDHTGLTGLYDAVAKLPGVTAMASGVGLEAFVKSGPGSQQPAVPNPDTTAAGATAVQLLVATDSRFGTSVERPKLTSGRLFNPDRADEVVADRNMAQAFNLRVGSRLGVSVAPTSAEGPDFTKAKTLNLKVVGLAVARDNVVAVNALASQPTLLATPALLRQFDPSFYSFDGGFVRLRRGVSRAVFGSQAEALVPQFPDAGATLFVADEHEQANAVEHAIRPQAAALALFSLLAAVTALFVVGQIVSRQLFLAGAENPTLRALGMGRSQLTLLGLGQVAVAAAGGAVIAALLAVAASPLMPIGPARIAEPHPGISVNWAILGLGAIAIIVLLVARVAWPALRLASAPAGAQGAAEAAGAEHPSRLLETATRAGAPASAAVGLRLALEPGRGRTAVPVRSALAGTVLAVAAVAAAFTFGTNLVRLVHSPKLYGQTWNLSVDTQFGQVPAENAAQFLRQQKGVTGWTYGDHGSVTIAGHEVPTIELARGEGPELWPALLEGRNPRATDEVVLGTKTLRAIHGHVGQTVSVTPQGASDSQPMRIVGRAVFPFFGRGSFAPTGLGDGVAMQHPAPEPNGFNFFLMRLAPDARTAADIARFRRNLAAAGACPGDQVCGVSTAQRPVDILNYSRVQGTPLALAALLAGLAVATVAHLLVTSIRRRRRDLAVLKSLGFVRRQVSAAVAWQATTLAVLALLVGLPAGAAAGRWIWLFFAGRLGVGAGPQVPVLSLLLAVPIALAIANLLAAGPGWVAGRLKPAPVLRTE